MRLLQLKKNLFTKIAFMFLVAGLISSCSKDKNNVDDPRAGYPKTVSIEYRVTALSAGLTNLDIRYTNETGADTELTAQSLPFSKIIRKSVTYASDVAVSITSNAPGSAKLEIFVDGKSVASASPVSQQYLNGIALYAFH
ncbi:hypothetical protein [Pedobacter caeni]|uniref:Uncharacterized protein n=1 Tax=Pedobacter caeni TaxID=288992 RepID=A0A1M5PMS4_9SPHI|nr:hypothetical protein [Pedobacter caeni]SHH03034.1 hypothetical protein SAMN04488522_11016 [Pedobacter caeni]